MDKLQYHKDMAENLSAKEILELSKAEAIEVIEKADYFFLIVCKTEGDEIVKGETMCSPISKELLQVFSHRFMDWIFTNTDFKEETKLKNT